jgi:hypothetical protein
VPNPGFENGFNPNGTASSWGNNTFGTSEITFEADSVTPYSGKYAQKIVCNSFADGAIQFTTATGFTVLKSRAYQVSVRLKGTVAGKVTLQLRRWLSPYTNYSSR